MNVSADAQGTHDNISHKCFCSEVDSTCTNMFLIGAEVIA